MSGSMKIVPANGGNVSTGGGVVEASSPSQLPKSTENTRVLNTTVFFIPKNANALRKYANYSGILTVNAV